MTNFSYKINYLISFFCIVLLTACGLSKKKVIHLNSISIVDFGAYPNDAKDDTRNIQNALDYLSKRGGGILAIPEGTYLLSRKNTNKPGCIYIPSNVKIRGNNQKKSILKLQPNQGNYTRLIYIEREENVVLSNLTIDGSRDEQLSPEAPNEHLHGIFIHSGIDIQIKNCTFHSTGGDGILIHGPRVQSKNINIQNCTFRDNRRNGITLGSGFNGVVIDSCFFDATNIFASPIDSEPDNGKCENATFSNNIVVNRKKKSTIVTLGGHVQVVGYKIFNNKFENCGLHLVRAFDAEIFKNFISTKGKRDGIKAIYESSNIEIYDNKILSEGDGISLIATNASHPHDFKIHRNFIEVKNEDAFGIRIQGTKNIEIDDNKISAVGEKSAAGGVFLRSTRTVDNISIKNNEIKNFNTGMTLGTYRKYQITNLKFEKNSLEIAEKGPDIKYTCPKMQIGSQVQVINRNNKKSE